MLTLTRRPTQSIVFLVDGVRIEVVFSGRNGNNVRLSIDAPRNVEIIRGELEERNDDERVSEEAD